MTWLGNFAYKEKTRFYNYDHMLEKLIVFLKKHSERATVIGLGLGLVIFIGMGIYLQKSGKEKVKIVEKKPVKVELKVKSPSSSGGSQGDAKKTTSFFLRPTPDELLDQLAGMENLQEDVAQKKLQYLRVLWPVYFFSIEKSEAKETIVLDMSEDGFGVEVQGEVKSADYPELGGIEAGDKLWVAGEIAAVDPSGTGTVYLNIELLDFSEAGPSSVMIEQQVQE